MSIVEMLEAGVGGRWVGIRFLEEVPPSLPLYKDGVRLCEALTHAASNPLTIMTTAIQCPGARWCLKALSPAEEGAFPNQLAREAHIDGFVAARAIAAASRLSKPMRAISFNGGGPYDLAVSYAQPETVMHIVRRHQELIGTPIATSVSTVMSVCSNVVVQCHQQQELAVSFGCPDSRRFGGIGRDRLVVGLPQREVHRLYAR